MTAPKFDLPLSSIRSLTEAITNTRGAHPKGTRVFADGHQFEAINKLDERAKGSLGNVLTRVNEILDQTLSAMQSSSFKGINQTSLTELEKKISVIEKWSDQSTQAQRWKFLHFIPFSSWRKNWLTAQDKYDSIKQKISDIRAHSSQARHDLANQQMTQLLSSIQEKKEKFITTVKEKSEKIKSLLENKPTQPDANELIKFIKEVSRELSKMSEASKELQNLVHVTYSKFEENNIKGKTIYLQVTSQEAKQAEEKIKEITDEVAKLTDSAVFFLEASFPDASSIFFTPMADPEKGTPKAEAEPTFADVINQKLEEGHVLIDHCDRLLRPTAEKDQAQQAQSNLGSLTLAYVRAKKVLDECQSRFNFSTDKLQERMDEAKQELQEAKTELKIKEQDLANLHSPWRSFINLFSKDKRFQTGEAIRATREDIQTKTNKIISKEELIQRFKRSMELKEPVEQKLNEFTKKFDAVSAKLHQEKIIDDQNKPAGHVKLTFTNPLLAGEYHIPTDDLSDVADAYQRYINELSTLQRSCSSTSTSFSILNTLIQNQLEIDTERKKN